MFSLDQLKTVARRAATEAGFDLAGVAAVGAFPELESFPAWIAAGHAGEMAYMEARDEYGQLKRAALDRVVAWARSVVVCGINYNAEQPYSTEFNARERGWISRYAWTRHDYHTVVLKKLKQVEAQIRAVFAAEADGRVGEQELKTRSYVDTGPLVERVYAKYAGIGWIGKNTCIINQQLGSWLFLGVILTSLELPPDIPAPDRCGSCTRCLDACPTNAFVGPYQLDAKRCISYLTIEKRGNIPEELRAGMGRHIFGCDVCQDVCPWNRKAPISSEIDFAARTELVDPPLAPLAEMTPERFSETFRGSPVRRAKLSGLRRNAVIAMANSKHPDFLPTLQKLTTDEDSMVAEHAKWAVQEMTSHRNRKRTA